MRSAIPKVLHEVAGRPMLGRVLDAAFHAGVDAAHVVVGHQAEAVERWIATDARVSGAVDTVCQGEQLGTAHALRVGLKQVPDGALVAVLYGDVPLVAPELIRALIAAAGDGLALVSARPVDPTGYGRIVRDAAGRIQAVVEERDATSAQRALNEVNTGLMAAPRRRFDAWLERVGNDNAKGEYYLTDVVALAAADGCRVTSVEASAAERVAGVNDPRQLAAAERCFQRMQAFSLMSEGLRLADPERFDLRGELSFGQDVYIDVGCVLEGSVKLGDGVVVGPYAVLRDVRVARGTRIASHSVLDHAVVGADCRVGPFSRLRPGAHLANDVHVGNFVEVKNARVGEGSKANHLAYVGDADIGARVNLSAGVITCNYDGANKYRTTISDDAFVGSDSQLVAPVTVGAGAFIAAGSTIVHDVPAGGLTVCRARDQKSYPDWERPRKRK